MDKRGALEQARPNLCHLRLVKVFCVFLLTSQPARSNLCHVGSVCSSHLGGTTHLVDKRGALEQARPNLCDVFSVKVLCVILLTLEQARSHLCHVGSMCSSHLGGTTHLVDKRGTLEQARLTFYFLPSTFSQSLLCVSLKPRASTIQSVPSRFNVFIPSRWHHASRGQTGHPRASTTHFLPSTLSQSVVCFS